MSFICWWCKIFHAVDCNNGAIDAFYLQSDINHFYNWCTLWHLNINFNKCYAMIYSSNKSRISNVLDNVNPGYVVPTYYLNGQVIQNVSCYKDLGILYSDKHYFNQHIDLVCKKSLKTLYSISKSFHFSSKDVWQLLYNAYVCPIHDYGCCIWSPISRQLVNRIEKVQWAATNFILDFPKKSYIEWLNQCHFITLEKCREFFDLCMIYKLMNNCSFLHLHDYDVKMASSKRLQWNICPKFPGKHGTEQEFIRCTIPKWNSLPNALKGSKSLATFKCNLYKHFLSKP